MSISIRTIYIFLIFLFLECGVQYPCSYHTKSICLPENPLVHWKISYGKDFYRKGKDSCLP